MSAAADACCFYFEDEPEPGWIETDNNGPIVPCPVCNLHSLPAAADSPAGMISSPSSSGTYRADGGTSNTMTHLNIAGAA
ncbi:hypothetical protein NKJ51_12520 [Mesorhizobium sp. M0134]|uniref:hypothetical protein n=1 Tax=Mesorhizobium sp. M0134 TaxID=2956889 RepID=UPI00333A0FBE